MEKQDKTVLITGGTSGMGLATAQLYLQKGAKVIITGRYQETLDITVEQLGPNAHGLVSDAASYIHGTEITVDGGLANITVA